MSDITIIMPIFNKEKYLMRSINSVLQQSFENFTLLLINDGSTDNSLEIIKQNINDPRVLYFEHKNRGVSYTRNKGIDLAVSNYITFLDADDEYSPHFLEKMMKGIGDSDVVYCGYYVKSDTTTIKAKMNFLEGDILVSFLNNKLSPHTNCWLISKEFLNNYNIRFSEDINWGEDKEFFSKVLLHDKEIKCVNEHLTYFNHGVEDSLSENNIDKIAKDIIWMEKLKRYTLNNESDKARRRKVFSSIDTYRLPASIIYRINSNLKNMNSKECLHLLKSHNSILKRIRLFNGIRSIKLLFYYFKIFSNLLKRG